ncbi:hypothetical protein LWC35_16295 [Pseudonocardia kujensis]|uniref:hypothetical protein n=1 Tax=Pseudonocardia kujensis TaxID=1128675 RepID=UPI001E310B01|nr:hypothetical protein [Pseudonocardia kujensis]MCE0764456.1 hypothetical protein [Pseudonocardia kujensis]
MAITDVDRLLDGDGGPRDLRRLLDAAAAPGSAAELRGERDALAAFAAAATSRGRWRLRRATVTASGAVAAKSLAAALAVVGTASGGFAIAAGDTHPAGPNVDHGPAESPTWSAPGEHVAGVAGAALTAASTATAATATSAAVDAGGPVTGQSVAAHGTGGAVRVDGSHGRGVGPSGPTARGGWAGSGGNSNGDGAGSGGSGDADGSGTSVGEAGNSGKVPPGLAKKAQDDDEQ